MKNFNYNIPTKVLFGRGKVNEVGKEAKRYGDKVLLVYVHAIVDFLISIDYYLFNNIYFLLLIIYF